MMTGNIKGISRDVEKCFPAELLKAPKEVRLEFFRKNTIKHIIMQQAFEDMKNFLGDSGKKIVFLIGPAGVGKSCLLSKIEEYLLGTSVGIMETDPNIMPCLRFSVTKSSKGAFDWTSFYKALLQAANEPLIEYKGKYAYEGKEDAYRGSAISCLINRKVKYILIDEAQHMEKTIRGQTLFDQLETLKSFVDSVPCIFILVGPYTLVNYLTPSSQVNRRSAIVHFSRYHAEIKREYEQFANILFNLELRIPVGEFPDLVGNLDYIYSRCMGCVGVLKDWLCLGLELALNKNGMLTINDLRRVEIDSGRCLAMARESIEGEALLNELISNEKELYRMLKIPNCQGKVKRPPEEIKAKSSATCKPGERMLGRDSIGV